MNRIEKLIRRDALWQPNVVFNDEYGFNEEAFTSDQQWELENKVNNDTLLSPLLQSRERRARASHETGPTIASGPAVLDQKTSLSNPVA